MLKYKYNASKHILRCCIMCPNCIKLQPSKYKGIQTCMKQKIPVIVSCELFVLQIDDQCFHKVKFHIVSVEGSVIISCATSINLNLIQIPNQLDNNIPDYAGLIYSSADAPDKLTIYKATAQVVLIHNSYLASNIIQSPYVATDADGRML